MFAPSRVRGLKPMAVVTALAPFVRTFTGAWIETSAKVTASDDGQFAPSRVRGLKHRSSVIKIQVYRFAPSRVRGLKPKNDKKQSVAIWFAPSRVRGLKHLSQDNAIAQLGSHLHGCVD